MTTCYRQLENSLYNVSVSDIPCSGSNPTGCCVYGDFCMSNGICHYTKATTVGSGYYLQSCTDSTFQSSIGQETFHCTTLDYPDVVYNATAGLWACCSSDITTGVHCSVATNETWAAPAPDALATIASIEQAPATTASSSATPATSPTSSTTSSASSTSTPSNSSANVSSRSSSLPPSSTISSSPSSNTTSSMQRTSLSAGADAGIGIGAALAVIALIALAFFSIKSVRKRNQGRQSGAMLFGAQDPTSKNDYKAELGSDAGQVAYDYKAQRFAEKPRFPQEMPSEQARYEVAGHQRYELGGG